MILRMPRVWNGLWGDLRLAVRSLRKAPLFTAISISILTAGLGANIAIFNIVNTLLLRPLPVEDAGRLVSILPTDRSGRTQGFTWAAFEELRRNQRHFSAMSARASAGIRAVEAGGMLSPRAVVVASADYFIALGVKPFLGATFQPGAGDRERLAVIGHRFWKTQMGARHDAIGAFIRIDGHPYTVAAVLPENYHGFAAGDPDDITIPVSSFYDPGWLLPRPDFEILARLEPGVSIDQAREQLRSVWPAVKQASVSPALSAREREEFLAQRLYVSSASRGSPSDDIREHFARRVLVLLGAVGLTLLIACVNIAGLMLSRAAAHAHDASVRAALGAGRFRIMRQAAAEAMLLVAPAAAAGSLLGTWLSRKLADFMWIRVIPHDIALNPDARVFGFVVASALLTCLLASALPAWQLTRIAPAAALYGAGRGGAASRRQWAGRALVVAQSALAVVLLTAAGLFAASLMNIKSLELKFKAKEVLAVQLAGRPGAYDDPSFVPAAHYSSLLERIRNIPGVRAAAVSKQIPVNSATAAYTETVSVPGAAAETGSYRLDVGPGFFEALGIPILRGRDFDFADGNSGTRLAIVSESLAIRLFGSPDAVGRGISVGASQEWQNATVIGVASDANVCNIGIRNSAVVYLPIFQQPSRLYSLMLAVRSHGPPDSIRNEVLGTIDGMGREYPLLVEPLSGLIDRMLVRERLMAALAGFFGAFPLVLACLGLYGMVSYQISRRTAEIGVRLALGASRWSVVAMVVRESVMVVALGVVFGIPLSFAAAYAARSVLFGISPADPRFPALAALALALSATLAALVPAIRAMRVNPAIALRAE